MDVIAQPIEHHPASAVADEQVDVNKINPLLQPGQPKAYDNNGDRISRSALRPIALPGANHFALPMFAPEIHRMIANETFLSFARERITPDTPVMTFLNFIDRMPEHDTVRAHALFVDLANAIKHQDDRLYLFKNS